MGDGPQSGFGSHAARNRVACKELERFLDAYASRVEAFFASVDGFPGFKGKSIMEWHAECQLRMDECAHASAAIVKHVADHGCANLSPADRSTHR
jgi:hypothetical protein